MKLRILACIQAAALALSSFPTTAGTISTDNPVLVTEAETETVPLLEDESVPLSGNMDTHSQGNTAVKMFAGFLILLLLAAAGFIYRYVRQHRDEA